MHLFIYSFILAELSELFAPFGNVLEASVIKDYGFVVRRKKNTWMLVHLIDDDLNLALWHR